MLGLLVGLLIMVARRHSGPVPPAPEPTPAPVRPVMPPMPLPIPDTAGTTQWGWPDRNEEWLARTVLGEAAQPDDGPVHVAEVIVNRAVRRGLSIRAVVTEPGQFRCWAPLWDSTVSAAERANFDRIRQPQPEAPYAEYLDLARRLLSGEQAITPAMRGVEHYVARWYYEALHQLPRAQVDPGQRWILDLCEVPLERRYDHVFLGPCR